MQIIPLKTPLIKIGDDLFTVFLKALKTNHLNLSKQDIVVITSKVVSLSENRLASLKDSHLKDLIKKEADIVLSSGAYALTYTQGLLIPNAGIDQSNSPTGQVILYPKNPQTSADNFYNRLKNKFKFNKIGVLIIDSHCQPLRQGVTGVALSYQGFSGVKDCRGQPDLFGEPLKVTKQNLADGLSAAASVVMGEADERIPFVIIRGAPVIFTSKKIDSKKELRMKAKECLFKKLYPRNFNNRVLGPRR